MHYGLMKILTANYKLWILNCIASCPREKGIELYNNVKKKEIIKITFEQTIQKETFTNS